MRMSNQLAVRMGPRVGGVVSSDPSAGFALYLPFSAASPTYRVGASTYSAPTALPGYSYTRSGAKGELNNLANPSDVVDDFTANIPAIMAGVGYWSRGALTNSFLQSQDFTSASWTNGGSATRTANVASAPDGTVTLDRWSATGNSCEQYQTLALASQQTVSVFAKYEVGSPYLYIFSQAGAYSAFFNLQTGVVSTLVGSAAGYMVACGNGIYRCVMVTPGANGTTGFGMSRTTSFGGSSSGDTMLVWQGQIIDGNHPAGGPIIATAGATASIGSDAFSFTFPNGTYAVTYTFSDDTTDVIPALVVAGGVFTIPTTYSKAIRLVTIPV